LAEFVVKTACMALILGFITIILPDGGLKNFARTGFGIVMAAAILFPAAELIGGSDAVFAGVLSEGRFRNFLQAAELREDAETQVDGAGVENILVEYRLRLSKEAQKLIAEKTGCETDVSFTVCGDITSKNFGEIEYIHCKVLRFNDNEESADVPGGSIMKDVNGIKKIEITSDGIQINGGEKNNENAEKDELNEQRETLKHAIIKVLQGFCGVDAEQCNVFWEE